MMRQVLSRRFGTAKSSSATLTKTDMFIEQELAKSAHNYHPIPKVLNRGKGVNVWDVEGKVFHTQHS